MQSDAWQLDSPRRRVAPQGNLAPAPVEPLPRHLARARCAPRPRRRRLFQRRAGGSGMRRVRATGFGLPEVEAGSVKPRTGSRESAAGSLIVKEENQIQPTAFDAPE